MIDGVVDVGPEPLAVDLRRAREHRNRGLRRDELPLTHRCQLPHWNPVAGDDKRLSSSERAHDFTTLVA